MENKSQLSQSELTVEETSRRPVMSCYALDLEVTETASRPVMSCYALDLPEAEAHE